MWGNEDFFNKLRRLMCDLEDLEKSEQCNCMQNPLPLIVFPPQVRYPCRSEKCQSGNNSSWLFEKFKTSVLGASCSNRFSTLKTYSDTDEKFIEIILPYVKLLKPENKFQLRGQHQNAIYDQIYANDPERSQKRRINQKDNQSIRAACAQDEDEIFYWGLLPYFKEVESDEAKLKLRLTFLETLYEHLHSVS